MRRVLPCRIWTCNAPKRCYSKTSSSESGKLGRNLVNTRAGQGEHWSLVTKHAPDQARSGWVALLWLALSFSSKTPPGSSKVGARDDNAHLACSRDGLFSTNVSMVGAKNHVHPPHIHPHTPVATEKSQFCMWLKVPVSEGSRSHVHNPNLFLLSRDGDISYQHKSGARETRCYWRLKSGVQTSTIGCVNRASKSAI